FATSGRRRSGSRQSTTRSGRRRPRPRRRRCRRQATGGPRPSREASPTRGRGCDPPPPPARSDLGPRLGQHRSQDRGDLLELVLTADERRRQLHDRVTPVVGPADETGVVEGTGEEASEEPFALVVVERLTGLLVLDQLDPVEVPGSPDVADNGQITEGLERSTEVGLVRPHVLQ